MCVGLTVFNSCNSKQLQEVARKVDFKYSISTCSFATISWPGSRVIQMCMRCHCLALCNEPWSLAPVCSFQGIIALEQTCGGGGDE